MQRSASYHVSAKPSAMGKKSVGVIVNSHVLVVSTGTSGSQLLSHGIGQSGSETLHDGRVKRLLDGTPSLLHLGLVLVDGRLRRAILKDAVYKPNRSARRPYMSAISIELSSLAAGITYTM